MCLILVAVDAHPNYRVVIAANRDEFYDRPAAPASFWPEASKLLAGRDLRAGGTWLGVTRTGRMAALTAYRDPEVNRAAAPSRGILVSGFLLGREEPVHYLEQISANAHRYNGFNLIVGRDGKFHYYSNRASGIRELGPGIHGLSNHLLDTPWPKVEKGRQALHALLTGESICPEDLFHFLLDRTDVPDECLPETGVGLQMERMLSPVFISSPGYGTRASTVILLDRTGRVTFIERSFQNGSEDSSAVEHSFMLEADPLSEIQAKIFEI
ncbi:MAG TPA: NRDE family protein [Acidobacteriota bacterium]|nr:NRDE family protein [Acidobacteriota bacterium]